MGGNGGSFAQKKKQPQAGLATPSISRPDFSMTSSPGAPPQIRLNDNGPNTSDNDNERIAHPQSTGGAAQIQQRMSPNSPRPGIGPRRMQGGNDPYYNPSLPGTRAGVNFNTDSPSMGNDPSGLVNQRNPNADPSMPFVQRGTSGGYIGGIGTTIGPGRSITPEQYQAQIAQARAAGVPDEYIQAFLRGNPGDSNRILEGYASDDGGRYASAMATAQQTPWQNFQQPTPAPGTGIGPQGLTPGMQPGTDRMTGTQGRLGYRPPTSRFNY